MRASRFAPWVRPSVGVGLLGLVALLGGCIPPPREVCTETLSPWMKMTAGALPFVVALACCLGVIAVVDRLYERTRPNFRAILASVVALVAPSLCWVVDAIPLALFVGIWVSMLAIPIALVTLVDRRDSVIERLSPRADTTVGVLAGPFVLALTLGAITTTNAINEAGRTCEPAGARRASPSTPPLPAAPASPAPG